MSNPAPLVPATLPMKLPLISLPLLLAAALLGGCASVQHAAPDQDAALKRFEAPSGLTRIYIYRNEFFGTLAGLDLSVDGKPAGTTKGKTFVVADVPPGAHEIVSRGENTSTLNLNTYLGEPSYVWQEVKMGLLSAGSRLHSVDPATGRAGVLETSLVSSPLMAAPVPAAAAPAAPTAAVPAMPAAKPVAVQALPAVAALPVKQLAAAPAVPAAAMATMAASQYEYEAERAAKERGCLGPEGVRPEARLARRDGAVEDFTVQCAPRQLRVRCELGMCRALDQAQ